MFTEEDKKELAKALVDELINRLRIGVGKTVLDRVWNWAVLGALLVILYLYAKSQHMIS